MFSVSVPWTIFLWQHYIAFDDSLEVFDYAHFDELLSLHGLGEKSHTSKLNSSSCSHQQFVLIFPSNSLCLGNISFDDSFSASPKCELLLVHLHKLKRTGEETGRFILCEKVSQHWVNIKFGKSSTSCQNTEVRQKSLTTFTHPAQYRATSVAEPDWCYEVLGESGVFSLQE